MTEIKNAIADVNKARRDSNRGESVFSAAANNEGAKATELFPASLPTVISVRGTDHVGSFIKQYNPPPRLQNQRSFLYGTLGRYVPYDFGDPLLQVSGCSAATPILAGIAAMVMQYVNLKTDDTTMRTNLWSKDGMLQTLYHMSIKDSGTLRYVTPWKLFRLKDDKAVFATIMHALAEIEPRLD